MYRVKIGQEYIWFEFLFQSMEEASIFMETCLLNNNEEEFRCKIELIKEEEEENEND